MTDGLLLGEDTIAGRKAGGHAAALTPAEVLDMLGVTSAFRPLSVADQIASQTFFYLENDLTVPPDTYTFPTMAVQTNEAVPGSYELTNSNGTNDGLLIKTPGWYTAAGGHTFKTATRPGDQMAGYVLFNAASDNAQGFNQAQVQSTLTESQLQVFFQPLYAGFNFWVTEDDPALLYTYVLHTAPASLDLWASISHSSLLITRRATF